MTQQNLHKAINYTTCCALLSLMLMALLSEAYAIDCSDPDYRKRDIYGACPAKPIPPLSTKCDPLINKYNDSLFVPIAHPDDPKVPARCKPFKNTAKYRSRYNVMIGENNDATCQMRELGDDDNAEICVPYGNGKTGARCKSCEKVVDKGNNACLWRAEDGICSGGSAAAASANPSTPGHAKFYNGEAENICENASGEDGGKLVPQAPNPYADTGAPTVIVDGTRYTMPDDPTQLAMVMGTFDFALDADQDLLNAQAFSFSGLDKITNMMGLKMPFIRAGQFNKQAAKQFAPSLDGLLGSVQKQIMGKLSGSIGSMQSKINGKINSLTGKLNSLQKLAKDTASKPLKEALNKTNSKLSKLKKESKIDAFGDIERINQQAGEVSSSLKEISSLASSIPGGGAIASKLQDFQGELGKISQIADLKNIPGLEKFNGLMANMMNSVTGGFGFQIRSDITDHTGKRIGPSIFKAQEGAKHVYDRVMKTVAVRKTPAYATYDPADYKPGQEIKMALELAKKTPEEILHAKDLSKWIGNDAYALTGDHGGDIMKTLLPNVYKLVNTGGGVEKFLSGGEGIVGEGLKLAGIPAAKGSISSLINANTTIQQIKSTPFSQIFNATDLYAPRASLRLFPERDHYSPCMSKGTCKVTKDYVPYPAGVPGLHTPYNPSERDGMRCSGTINDPIRVDVLSNRYREFNAHFLMRNTYNRWCAGDKGGCCIGCTCPPKPCLPEVPCWSSACWGVPISAESPPCAMRHDPVHDRGQQLGYCDHPRVKDKLKQWMSATGGKVDLSVKSKPITEVCHDLAKPVPIINKLPLGDIFELAKNNMQVPEGATFRERFGRSRPYVAMDTTGKELGQTGFRPDYFSDVGHRVTLLTGGLKNKLDQKTAGLDINRFATDNITPNFGFSGSGLGIVKGALAYAGGTTAGGGQACLGGLGGATGGGCGSNGVSPSGSIVEMTNQQRRTAQWFNQKCLPNYEKTWNIFSASVMASEMATGGTVQRIIGDKLALKSKDAKQAAGSMTRTVSLPGAFRGHYNAPPGNNSKAWPDGGGCRPAKKGRGFEALAMKMQNNEVGSCVIMLPRGGAKLSEKPGLPNLAVVMRGSKDNAGSYLDVVMTNVGTGPDRAGITQAAGTRVNRRFRIGKLPPTTQKEMERAMKNASSNVTNSCVHPWSECIVPEKVEWVCFSEEENQCVKD